MRCLLVDDDFAILNVLKDFVNWDMHGINKIDTACNITKAKTLIKENAPDVIICDIEMPKGSGLDLIKWVREKKYKCQFIFLTCHEKFEFASTAMTYDAVAYVTKPFDSRKIENAIIKAVEKIKMEKRVDVYSQHSKYWLESRALIEQGFWRDLLFYNIFPQVNHIENELKRRHLSIDTKGNFFLLLFSINGSQVEELSWDSSVFNFAFSNLTCEIIFGEQVFCRFLNYTRNQNFYNIAVLPANADMTEVENKCNSIIHSCKEYLQCEATCYISKQVEIQSLAYIREELEQTDKENIAHRGKLILQEKKQGNESKGSYSIDINLFNQLFFKGEKLKIVNTLKNEMECLKKENRLDSVTFHCIQHDFLQVVYSFLYKNEVQAHILFLDQTSKKLYKNAENSLFDMMKWATYITNKAIDYIKEMQQSESVVEKAKRFIQLNYSQNITNQDVADHVFLTPGYLAKIYKAETGQYINNYINECRIKAAKELLVGSDASISDIALQSGFDNISYFSTVFKKITGDTPCEFRKKNRQQI